MKILLTGASGQLGQELQPLLRRFGQVTTVDRDVETELSATCLRQDLSDLNRVETLLDQIRPDLVFNAAAFTAVDMAEKNSSMAYSLNGDLPACLARWAERNGRFLFHYSTDYVFDGEKGRPYLEGDEARPNNVYGSSKLAGEQAIASAKCRHIILRTSWVYSSHGSNFVLSMLRLARERASLSIVNDQTGCPTWARNLARVSAEVTTQVLAGKSDQGSDGLYHYCDRTVSTWHDFACSIFKLAHETGLLEKMPVITAVNSKEYPQIAARPAYSVLNTDSIRNTFGVEPVSLKESLRLCLQELPQYE